MHQKAPIMSTHLSTSVLPVKDAITCEGGKCKIPVWVRFAPAPNRIHKNHCTLVNKYEVNKIPSVFLFLNGLCTESSTVIPNTFCKAY